MIISTRPLARRLLLLAAALALCAGASAQQRVLRVISDRADDSAHQDFLRFTREIASVLTRLIVGAVLTAPDA